MHDKTPGLAPKWIMTDRDLAQINACGSIFLGSTVLLCWWHILHAWQQHFVISRHPELWEKLKAWIWISNTEKFEHAWVEIQSLAPPEFTSYLNI